MVNEQLLAYVRAQRASGLSKEAITQALGGGGWTIQDVNEAFMVIDKVVAPPSPPAVPSMQNPPRTIVPPPGAMMNNAPVGSIPAMAPAPAPTSIPTPTPTPAPRPAASVYSTARPEGGGRGWIFGVVIFIVVAVIAVGVVATVFYQDAVRSLISLEAFFPTPEPFEFEEIAPTPQIATTTTIVDEAPTSTASTTGVDPN